VELEQNLPFINIQQLLPANVLTVVVSVVPSEMKFVCLEKGLVRGCFGNW